MPPRNGLEAGAEAHVIAWVVTKQRELFFIDLNAPRNLAVFQTFDAAHLAHYNDVARLQTDPVFYVVTRGTPVVVDSNNLIDEEPIVKIEKM